jgi:hypothetical protein
MSRAVRITWDRAIEIFEAPVDPEAGRLPAAHVMEDYVHELWDGLPGDLYLQAFIQRWMAWKGKRQGYGYTVLDESKPIQAAQFVEFARYMGLIDSRGHGLTRRLWVASKTRLYERDASGGRLVLPGQERGARRRSILERHTGVVGPVIAGLIRQLIDHPAGPAMVHSDWIFFRYVPNAYRGKTIAEAADVIASAHEDMETVQEQLKWVWRLRITLIALGDVPEVVPPDEDMDILGRLAP